MVWRAFGADIPNYCEPFAGSLAVLLGRPGGAGKIETVNDVSRLIANFWRAVTDNPEEVAEHCDWPVNEADLHARHLWLVKQLPLLKKRMHEDPDFYDTKIAGWWVWGICQWIGGGWCVEQQRPHLAGVGRGVHSKARNAKAQCHPRLGPDNGVHSRSGWNTRPSLNRRPELGFEGKGVHLPSLGNDRGLNGVSAAPCVEWFRELQARLRRVRVACGDWKRVLGPSVLGKGKNVGGRRPCAVFLDPPYDQELRDEGLYSEDAAGISCEVREWALEHGDDRELRIALCGYLDEHAAHMPASWSVYSWKAARGYAGADNTNRERERIWFSPFCLPFEVQRTLFDERRVST